MEKVISNLLKHFDSGTLSRRELMQGLALLAAAGTTASAAGFKGTTVNHISITVSDMQRSLDWYKQLFNLTEQKTNDPAVVRLLLGGDQPYFTFKVGKPAGTVDHFAIGIENFNQPAVTQEVKERGLVGNPDVGGITVKDPDGYTIQISSNK
jgi:catechol 2,3-dioxygenase-like lactoylglutathione lyase family enzyme